MYMLGYVLVLVGFVFFANGMTLLGTVSYTHLTLPTKRIV